MKKQSEETLLNIIRAAVILSSQKNVAKNLGVSVQLLCDVLKGRRPISERLANAMGYKTVQYFVEIKK